MREYPTITLPTTDHERIVVGSVSLLLMCAISGVSALAIVTANLPQFGWLFTLIVFVTEHLFVSMLLVFGLLLIWSIAMPAWVDRLFAFAWKKLYFMIALAVLPIVILLVLAAFGLTLDNGLVP